MRTVKLEADFCTPLCLPKHGLWDWRTINFGAAYCWRFRVSCNGKVSFIEAVQIIEAHFLLSIQPTPIPNVLNLNVKSHKPPKVYPREDSTRFQPTYFLAYLKTEKRNAPFKKNVSIPVAFRLLQNRSTQLTIWLRELMYYCTCFI